MHMVCSSMKPPTANLQDVLRRSFHFTLEGNAKEWLYTLPQHFTTLTWDQLKGAFLDEYFPASKTSRLKKEITSVVQRDNESMHEYWTRFITLLAQCPHHNISKNDLVNSFYEGLLPHHKPSIHAAANGSLRELSPNAAWDLIQKMATNDSQSGDTRKVYNTSSVSSQDILAEIAALGNRMEKRLSILENNVNAKQVNSMSHSQAIVAGCEYCGSMMHASNTCSRYEEVSSLYQSRNGPYQKRDPYSNTYNPGWRDHPNFRWGGNQGNPQGNFSNQVVPNQGASSSFSGGNELGMIVKGITELNSKFDNQKSQTEAKLHAMENKMDSCLQNVFSKLEQMETKHENLNSFVTQFSNNLSEQQAKSSGSIPSNTVINPKSLNAITLRSGKKIGPKNVQFKELEEDEEQVDEEIEVESPPAKTTQETSQAEKEASIQSEVLQEKKLLEKCLKQPMVQTDEEATTIIKGPMEKGSPSNSKGDESEDVVCCYEEVHG